MLRAHNVNTLEDRVRLLRKMVWFGEQAFDKSSPPVGGLRDPQMRQLGLLVVQPCRARDDLCELAAIYDFVKRPAPDGAPNVRYTGDIARKDTYQTALRTLQYRGGDCDDHAVLCAVLAMENGFEAKFRITSNYGDTWDHIFCMAGMPKHNTDPSRWIALDTTLPGEGKFNRQPPMAKFKDFLVGEM